MLSDRRPILLANARIVDPSRDLDFSGDLLIAEGVIRASDSPAAGNPAWDSGHPDPATSIAPWRIFNIGNNNPVKLTAYVEALEDALGRKAIIELLPLQAGDVPDTFADTSALQDAVGYRPGTSVSDGVGRFVEWYRAYFGNDSRI